MNTGYNGWANWETWIINLYFGDDQEQHETMAEQTEFDPSDMAELIESWVIDYINDTTPKLSGIVDEFLTTGLNQVDWHELAENWLSDCEKPEEFDQYETKKLIEEIFESGELFTPCVDSYAEHGEFDADTIQELCENDLVVFISRELDSIDWERVAEEINDKIREIA